MTKRSTSMNHDGPQKSFRRYTLAATGALAASGAAGTAQAEIIYTDVLDMKAAQGESIFFNMVQGTADIGTPTDPDNLEINWNTSVVADYAAWRIGSYLGDYGAFINDFPSNVVEFEEDPGNPEATKKKATKKKTTKRAVAGGNSGSNPPLLTLARLAAGELIDENRFGAEVKNDFDTGDGGQWDGGGTGYLGLKMIDPLDESSLFGWARVTVDEVNDEMTIHEFAISNDGSPIAASQVPEPSSLALLALGAVGLSTLRSRSRPRE